MAWRWTGLALTLAACTGDIGSSGATPTIPGVTCEEPAPQEPGAFQPSAAVVRRLTPDEYVRTVRDVVGVELDPAIRAEIPADRPVEGFVRIATGQTVLPDHVRAYFNAAFSITEDPAFAEFVAGHAECTDASLGCGEGFIASAGRALFRRPLDDDERAAFAALFGAVLDEDGTFDEAAAAVSAAMLQSPGFLYLLRREQSPGVENIEGAHVIGGYAMASRLSYFLWGTAPDEALYEAAERGDLDTAEGVANEAMRLLDNRERVADTVGRFLVDWGRLESLPDDDGLKGALIESAIAYYVDRVDEGADLFRLFSDETIIATPAVAERLGAAGEGVQTLNAPGAGGLLGQPGIIAGMTNADGGEIVARGLFLLSQLFCGTPPDFPADQQEEVDAFVEEQPEDASHRQIADARLRRPECGFCHEDFDPLAYAFEPFDARGFPREADEFGNALTTDGWIPGSLNGAGCREAYSGFADYMALLEGSARVRMCMLQRQAEFAAASRLEDGQLAALVDMEDRLDGGDHRALVRTLVQSPFFRTQERAQ